MESQEAALVKAFVEAINRRDLQAMEGLMSEDHTFRDASGETTTGRDTMVAGWRKYFTMFPDFHIRLETLLQDGDTLAAFGSTTGTYHGPRGSKPENKVGGPAAWQIRVNQGRIQLWQVYTDYTETWKVIEAAG